MRVAAIAIAAVALCGCLMTRYLAQAAHGQAELLGRSRAIDDVIADPEVDPRTRYLLAQIPAIKAFGAAHGLDTRDNYTRFVQLRTDATVWFVGAADPVALTPRKWCFPIVGCFTGLGWFDEDDALAHRADLLRQGFDAFARPASAYSTGGWFPDPVVSSMLSDTDDALPDLVNVILHESVHATVLVPDQPFFNESFAEYVADALTDRWVVDEYGAGSPEQVAWLVGQAIRRGRIARLVAAYRELDAIYKDKSTTRDAKLAAKKATIDKLVDQLRLVRRPNNASLIELEVYQAGGSSHARAHRACGDIRRLVAAARTLKRRDFKRDLERELGPIADEVARRCRQNLQAAP